MDKLSRRNVLGLAGAGLMAGEARTMQNVKEHGTMDRPWVMEKLKALNCEFHDEAY